MILKSKIVKFFLCVFSLLLCSDLFVSEDFNISEIGVLWLFPIYQRDFCKKRKKVRGDAVKSGFGEWLEVFFPSVNSPRIFNLTPTKRRLSIISNASHKDEEVELFEPGKVENIYGIDVLRAFYSESLLDSLCDDYLKFLEILFLPVFNDAIIDDEFHAIFDNPSVSGRGILHDQLLSCGTKKLPYSLRTLIFAEMGS